MGVYFIVSCAYLLSRQMNNQSERIDKARETYSALASLNPDSKFFWMNYVNFELGFYGNYYSAKYVYKKGICFSLVFL